MNDPRQRLRYIEGELRAAESFAEAMLCDVRDGMAAHTPAMARLIDDAIARIESLQRERAELLARTGGQIDGHDRRATDRGASP